MTSFHHQDVKIDVLKRKAYNYRWAEVDDDCIPLTAADPDFMAAKEVRDAIIDYAKEGYFSYTPKRGLPEFIDAIAKYLLETKNEKIEKKHILPIDSAARGMYVIAEAILEPGDEAIIFDPVDFLFRDSVIHAKGKIVLYPAHVVNGKIDLSKLESYITEKTKMIGLCNPHNPLGLLYSREDLKYILDLAEKYHLYIMNDEIWSDIVYPEKTFLSILNVDESKNDHVLSVFGFSKSFGIAGLRAGCIYTNNDEMFNKCIEASCVMSTAGGISSLSQVAGTACMNDAREWLQEFLQHLTKMRNYICDRINQMPGLSCRIPEATYLAYVDIREYGMSSEAFVDYIKEKTKVVLIPGGETFFGVESEGYIRICFATSQTILEEGLNRLEKGLYLLIEEKKNKQNR